MQALTTCLLIIFTTTFADAQDNEAISFTKLPDRIVHDQKEIWTAFPLNVTKGRYWKPMAGVVLGTGMLVELDPHDTPYFRRTERFDDFDRIFSTANTGLAEGLFPVAFFLTGVIRRDSYAEQTGLLSIEALADAEAVSEVFKNVSRRKRPLEIPATGDFSATWFKAGSGLLINRGSFLSGHATGAFSVATIVAERYRHHRWVPFAAYGLAGVVAFSRISNQNHFPSDVFAGVAIGFSVSHFVVLKRHP